MKGTAYVKWRYSCPLIIIVLNLGTAVHFVTPGLPWDQKSYQQAYCMSYVPMPHDDYYSSGFICGIDTGCQSRSPPSTIKQFIKWIRGPPVVDIIHSFIPLIWMELLGWKRAVCIPQCGMTWPSGCFCTVHSSHEQWIMPAVPQWIWLCWVSQHTMGLLVAGMALWHTVNFTF